MDQYNKERRQVFRVLISVSDKGKIVDFARALDSLEIEIVSTGGTYQTISEKGIDVIPVEKVTNFPEMMGGRVKTLHPLIFGGILARDSDSEDAEKQGIGFFDMVVCNLYPFREAVSKGVDSESLIESHPEDIFVLGLYISENQKPREWLFKGEQAFLRSWNNLKR